MDFNRSEKVPKGRLLPFYLGEDGNVYPLRFRSMEEVESVQKIVSMGVSGIMEGKIVIDTENPINDPEKNSISIYKIPSKKK